MNTEKQNGFKKPKIALLHFSGPPNVSGVDLIVRDQARLFRLYGYRVELVVGTGKRFRKDIPVHINDLINPKNPDIYKIRQQLEKGEVSSLFHTVENKLFNYLKRYVVRNDINTFIVHNIFTRYYNLPLASAITRLSKEMPELNVIIWVHDVSFFNQPDFHLDKKLAELYPWNIFITPQENFTYACVSEFLKDDLLHAFDNKKAYKEKVIVIPNTHDIQKFLGLSPNMRELYAYAQVEKADLVGCIPVRAVPRKRLDFAIDVANEIIKKGVNFKLLLTANMDNKRVQNIRYFHSLKKKIETLGLQDHVFLLEEYFEQFNVRGKPKPIIPIPELFIISDFLLMPSSLEGFGLPLIEAGMMRCPIFATDIPVFREVGTTNINYFKLNDSPQKVADFILRKIKSMPQSYFYRKVVNNYSMHRMFKEVVLPLVNPRPVSV